MSFRGSASGGSAASLAVSLWLTVSSLVRLCLMSFRRQSLKNFVAMSGEPEAHRKGRGRAAYFC